MGEGNLPLLLLLLNYYIYIYLYLYLYLSIYLDRILEYSNYGGWSP